MIVCSPCGVDLCTLCRSASCECPHDHAHDERPST